MPSDSCTSMITSFSLFLFSFLDETSFISFLHFFFPFSFSFLLLDPNPISSFAVSYLRFLFYSYFLFFFFLFSFVFLRNVTLALSSACRNVLCLQITRLFSTCTFLGVSSRTFTFSVRTFQTTREPTSFSRISLSIRERILHATKLSFAFLPPIN